MDPNATLAQLREAMEALAAFEDEPGTPDYEVVELFNALDRWLSTGGFLPEEWAR